MKAGRLFTKFSLVLLVLALLTVMESCKKDTTPTDNPIVEEIKIFINNDANQLSERIIYYNEPIVFSKNKNIKAETADHTWYYVASVASPVFNSETLSATHVSIIDDKAYVSYNVKGSVYAGGIEVIDLTNPALPTIISQELFDGVDINALAVDYNGNSSERKLWLAGSSFKKGAILREVLLMNGLLTPSVTDVSLSKSLNGGVISASANGIVQSADYIYLTSGQSHGGTYQLSTDDLTVLANEEYTHAKFPAVNGKEMGAKQVSLVTGENSKLYVYNVGVDRTANIFDIEPIYHQNVDEPYKGKSVLWMDEGSDIAYVSSGKNGLIAYDINTGAQVYTSPADMLFTGNSNGFAKDDDYVYLANGADGLYIAQLPEQGGEIIPVQSWDLDETHASANLVQTDGDWIFVAKGGGGFKILRKIKNGSYPTICDYDTQGLPECMDDPEEICESLMADLELTLPEYFNTWDAKPAYFLNENKEILLTEDAQVSITFIDEGAGFKNSLGYYFYNNNNPPLTAEDLMPTMTIIFPNASAEFSGGSLVLGDKIQIPGTFPPGTVVGFFFLANSWNGTEITDGLYTHYSIPEFNENQTQQHILMYDESCGDVIMSFEDVLLPEGDKDFNDIIFKINVEPITSINPTSFVQIPPVD